MIIRWVILTLWAVAGAAILFKNKISKFEYVLCWVTLIACLFERAIS